MVGSYSITVRELETIRRILYGKIVNNLRKHNTHLSQCDIEDIVSEILVWVLEKLSTSTNTNISKSKIQTIPFISDKLISMFISSYIKKHKYQIPFTSFITDDEQSMDIVEHLMYRYINSVDEINIDDIDDDKDQNQNQVNKKLDDFQIMQIVDELMDKLELERKKRYGNDSKFIVSRKIIRKYLYLLLKHGIDEAHRYKDTTLSDGKGKKYRLEKNLELLSTLV